MTPMNETVAVESWNDAPAIGYHDQVWSVWLHGSVAAIHDAGRLLLLVPVAVLTPAACALAMRLYRLGSVTLLD